MADYPLKNVDDDLWQKIKIIAAQEGTTIKKIILDGLLAKVRLVAQIKKNEEAKCK